MVVSETRHIYESEHEDEKCNESSRHQVPDAQPEYRVEVQLHSGPDLSFKSEANTSPQETYLSSVF